MSDAQRWWDGNSLPEGEIALVLFARTTSSGARVPVLGAVAAGSVTALLPLDQFSSFLEQHEAATIICHDAADLHWLLHGQFQESGLQRLWAFSEEARLVDIGILDQYVRCRPRLLAARPRALQRLIVDWVNIKLPDHDKIEQGVLAAMGEGGGDALGLALQVVQGIWRAYQGLKTKAARIDAEVTRVAERAKALRERPFWSPGGDPERAHELEEQAREFVSVFNRGVPASEPARVETTTPVSPEASPRVPFGPLGSGIDVQAAIAVNCPDRPVLQVDRDQMVEAAAANERHFEKVCRALWQDRRARDCFRWNDSASGQHVVRRDNSGRPVVQANNLQQWLRDVSGRLVDEHNLPISPPVTSRGEPSFEPEDWGILAACDRGLAAWRDLVRSCRFMQFRERVDRVDAQQVQYDVCPILRATAPDLAAIRSLGYRVFRPAADNVFVVVDLQHLHLRCFAAVYAQQRPGCPSRLADYLLNQDNPIEKIAAELYAEMNGDKSGDTAGDDWEERCDEFQVLEPDNAIKRKWVQRAEALLELLPLGLSPDLLQPILDRDYGLTLEAAKVERLRGAIVGSIAPELGDFGYEESLLRWGGMLKRSPLDAIIKPITNRVIDIDTIDTADAAVRNALMTQDPNNRVRAALQRASGDNPLSPELSDAVLKTATRTSAGRLVGPTYDLEVWREAGRLLADEAIKATAYALVRAGYPIVAVCGDEVVCEVVVFEVPEEQAIKENMTQMGKIAVAGVRTRVADVRVLTRLRHVQAW